MTHTDVETPLLIPKSTPLVPGKMYLRLYHGRTHPGQEMDDWGFDGPTFGPLSCYVHTYCCTSASTETATPARSGWKSTTT
jgi:hypothetical protein